MNHDHDHGLPFDPSDPEAVRKIMSVKDEQFDMRLSGTEMAMIGAGLSTTAEMLSKALSEAPVEVFDGVARMLKDVRTLEERFQELLHGSLVAALGGDGKGGPGVSGDGFEIPGYL
jgi:hypothetical protein